MGSSDDIVDESERIDESWKCIGLMGGLEINRRDVQRIIPNQGLNEEFCAFDIRYQGDSEIHGHATGPVTFARIAGWPSEVVFRGKIDVQVD